MASKKGIELSISMVVILVFSIVVLSMGIYFVQTIFFHSSELLKGVEPKTQQLIESQLNEGRAIVIYPSAIVIAKGKRGAIGIGVQNLGQTDKTIAFNVLPGPAADSLGAEIVSLTPQDVYLPRSTIVLPPKASAQTYIEIRIPATAQKGTYEILIEATPFSSQKAYVTVV